MNDRRNRAAVKRRLVSLADQLGAIDLGVEGRSAEVIPAVYAAPPAEATESCIYFAGLLPVDGTSENTGIRSLAAPNADEFIVQGTVDVFGFDTCEEAEEAVERVLNRLEAVLSGCQRLIDKTNGIADDFEPGDPCPYDTKASISAASLLSGTQPGDTWAARYSFSVQCRTDIQR